MTRRLLDLFCGGGAAAVGYARCGWEVVGVDIKRQSGYPFEFHQADALEYDLRGFDAIHASPPCQAYSPAAVSDGRFSGGTRGRNEPRLIAPTRERLVAAGVPYVIENVWGARNELRVDLRLCGVMFGLPIPRHRIFESSVILDVPVHPPCRGVARRYATERGWDLRDMTVTGKGRHAGTSDRWREIMDIDIPMTQHNLREAIPPAFTEWIGRQL